MLKNSEVAIVVQACANIVLACLSSDGKPNMFGKAESTRSGMDDYFMITLTRYRFFSRM